MKNDIYIYIYIYILYTLLGLVSFIFLLIEILNGVQVRQVCWPIKHSNTMVIEPAFGMKCSKISWYMAALTVDFRKHSGPTPADDMAAQFITDCGNFTLDFKQHGFCASPLFFQTLGPWFPNEMQNVLSSEKRTLDHWATAQFFFSLTQVRCFWRCFCLRRGLVALFLKMSERGDSWCTPALVHSLWSSSKCLNRLCLTVFSSLRSSLLFVHIFQPNFFLPVNLACNMLWYSTHWTATPFSNDPLWLTLFVEGVNERLLDHCQVSSVPHYCAFKEQDIPTIYTVWMVV